MEEKKKINLISFSYYSNEKIQRTIFEFCKKRETIPKYSTFFGKRPDVLDYPSDVLEFVKKGATSFHCSQEIWKDPLKIKTEMTPEQYNNEREGWDLLIDIDSKYFDYSKIAATLIIKALEFNGIKNFGIKFSGSKGFHIIVPWAAFPEELSGKKTKDMFPEWPRIIAQYLTNLIKDELNKRIIELTGENKLIKKEVIYLPTNEVAFIGKLQEYFCEKCHSRASFLIKEENKRKKIFRCSVCKYIMKKENEEEIFYSKNNDNSKKNPQNFKEVLKTDSLVDSVDLVLVAPRHLFRTPYSLHEKTALCSCVLDKNEIENFTLEKANPFKIEIKKFYPLPEKNEAKKLLINALDWSEKKQEKPKSSYIKEKEVDLSGIVISEKDFPPTILKILEGIKSDGRKRALTILLSFFVSLGFSQEYVEEKINEWNKKNYSPLKENYIKSQLNWFLKNKRLPPNYDKPIYRELGVFCGEEGFKNPINYTLKRALQKRKINK